MQSFLSSLRSILRGYWLVLERDARAAFTACRKCKTLGAYPCSICGLVPLCERCAREESIKLDKHKTTRAYVRAGGFGSYSETI
jgi:hypothetical protein